MMIETETDLLTISEAAKLLKISTVTIHRWLKQGRLPAYQVGPRYIRIRRQDLAKVLTPVARREGEAMTEVMPVRTTVRPLTEKQVQQRLEAIKQSEALIERMRARRGGKPLPSSWRLIRQAREERSRDL